MDKDSIQRLIAENRLSEAAEALKPDADAGDARAIYMLGRIAWKEGRKADAISLYEKAAALDPDSEAAVALEQARQIMDFYHRDLYNP